MKTSMWIVIVIVALFIGFLFGYAISVHTGIKAPNQSHQQVGMRPLNQGIIEYQQVATRIFLPKLSSC